MGGVSVDAIEVSTSEINAGSSLDAIHGLGINIDIVVTFSEPITTSVSSLILDNGLSPSYFSGSGTTSITYRHNTILGEDSSDLNVTGFNSGTGTSAPSGRTISTILPPMGGSATLGANSNIVIDGI